MFKKTIMSTVSTSLMMAVALPVMATEAVVRIPARRARGIESIAEIEVYPNNTGATTLNFRPTQELIRQVTFGGGSLLLSSDDPSCLSSESKGSGEPCEATLLYLQQKPKEAVPSNQRISSTRMTVLTDKNIYVFQVVLSSGAPIYSVVEIQPDTRQYTPLISFKEISNLVNGFKAASEQQLLNNPEFQQRVRRFVEIVKTEESLESAAARAGISMDVVRKLKELGNQSVPPSSQLSTPISREEPKN